MATESEPDLLGTLTPREREVLQFLRSGLSDEQIAQRLGISAGGVGYHVSEIIGKLGVRNRHEAAAWPERPPWWTTGLAPIALLWRKAGAPIPGKANAIILALLGGALLVALAVLALVLLLTTPGGDREVASPVVDGRIELPQSAISALEHFAFTTDLSVTAADGPYGLIFEGTFQKPDRLQGTLQLGGKFAEFYEDGGRPSETEIVVVGTHVWWREPDGEWQPGIEEGYETIDPLVTFRQYATPWFYLDALFFDALSLPVSGDAADINGVRSVPVHLDKPGLADVLRQGSDIYLYPDEAPPRGSPDVTNTGVSENVLGQLPQDFNIEIWFAEGGLYPTRIVFDYAVTEDDPSGLAFIGEVPMTLRLQMDIRDAEAEGDIEPVEPIPTATPTPTTVPGEFLPGQAAAVTETASSDPLVAANCDARSGSIGFPFLVWRTSGLEVLGGAVHYNLNEPHACEGDWPSIIYGESLDPPFAEVTHHYRVEGVTQLRVLVYLPELRVVEIRPVDGVVTDGVQPTPAPIPGGTPIAPP